MKKKKSILQKFSNLLGIMSFILAIVCAVFLYIKIKEVGMESPISASLLSSIFFFCFVGILFSIIGNANIPSFKVGTAIDTSLNSKSKELSD